MESFLYNNINKAERERDGSKILSLGPFAFVLMGITNWAQSNRGAENILDSNTFVYRGAKLPMSVIERYKKLMKENKEWLKVYGFTSTTLIKKEAYKFMFTNLKKDEVPVLYQITNLDSKGEWYFKLDNDNYSLFYSEQEVLFRSCSDFEVVNIKEEFDEQRGLKYFEVDLKFYDMYQSYLDYL